MSSSDYVLVRGLRDTRATFDAWDAERWTILRRWSLLALAIALALLTSVWLIASAVTPDGTPVSLYGINGNQADASNVAGVLFRNSLVLALHATACIAGFIAGASIPIAAAQRTGFSRRVHEQAGRFAILFVCGVTIFSLSTQAWILGFQGATIAGQLAISPGELVLSVTPHALIELVALFLPLAAWMIASRRGEWSQLLAATFVTVAIAIPMLIASALLEVFFWPQLLAAISPAA